MRPIHPLNPTTTLHPTHPNTPNNLASHRTTQNLYNLVTKYKNYTQIPEFRKQQLVLRKFVENCQQKVLFVFGPSGSGKHMFVQSFLGKYRIPYKYRAEKIQQNQNQPQMQQQPATTLKTLKSQILESTTKTSITQIQIYQDFPTPTLQSLSYSSSTRSLQQFKQFKQQFYRNLPKFQCKVIFILNSDIYNKYFVVPRDGVRGVGEVVLKGYTGTEVKVVLRDFVKCCPVFQWVMHSKDVLDQILEISNGDMRKVLLNVHRYTIDSQATKIEHMTKDQKSHHKHTLKNSQKFPLFHLLGKYLYSKRYDQALKKPRTYTYQQLQTSDPPFYFNPVQLLYKSNVPVNTFHQLLFQNYLGRVGRIGDVVGICEMFVGVDCGGGGWGRRKGRGKLGVGGIQEEGLEVFLMTWGIILKNKSSMDVEKKFTNFRKSQYKQICSQASSKRTLLHTYFPTTPIQSLIRFAYILKNTKPPKKYLLSTFIKKRTRTANILRDQNEKVMDEQEEEELMRDEGHECAGDFVRSYRERVDRKEKETAILREIQMEDQSDIDDDGDYL